LNNGNVLILKQIQTNNSDYKLTCIGRARRTPSIPFSHC